LSALGRECAKRREEAQSARRSESSCSNFFTRFLAASSDMEIPGEKGVHIGFGKANDFGREFDERQAALLHRLSIVRLLTFKRFATCDFVS